MAANEDEIRLRLQAETFGYRKAWADVRVQTARDLAQIKSTVTNTLNQTRVQAAQSLSSVRVNTAQQLAQIRVNTAAQLNAMQNTAGRALGRMGSQFEEAGRRMSVGLTLPLAALATAAVRSARNIDAQVNTLRAFTGSAEAAEKRLAQLIATAQKTPGLTTGLALQLDAQLRAAQATEQTIDRILPAVGRLNAVQRLEDPGRFVQNLIQLVTQNFERRDLKELVGQSPVAGQVIRELFNVDSPINGEAIRDSARRMGIRTVDEFFAAFADAAARNKGLANVTESIGTQFDKLVDRVSVALRPLGLAIIDAFKPVVDVAVPVIETLGKAFAALPTPIRTAIVLIGGVAAAIGPALFLTGSLISTIGTLQRAYVTLNALALIPTISNLRLLGQVMQGTAGLAAGAGATAAVSAGGWIALGVALSALVGTLGFITARYTEAGTAAEGFGAKAARTLLPLAGVFGALGFIIGENTAKTKELAQAQTAAVAPTRTFAAAVEEETATLRQLKRALEEAEIATRSRVAAAQRSYNEERISIAQATKAQIDALWEGHAAQLAVIDRGIAESRERLKALQDAVPQGLGAHGADDKDARAEREKLERLELDRLKLIDETYNKIEDLRSQQRIKERQLDKEREEERFAILQRGHARQLELFDLAARHFIERQRALAQAEVITYAEAQRRIAAEQGRGFEKRRLLLEAELKAAKGNAEKEAEILHQLSVLKEQAALFIQEAGGEASAAFSDDLDRMIRKVDEALERIDRLRQLGGPLEIETPGVVPLPDPGEGPQVGPTGLEPPPPGQWATFGQVVADVSRTIGEAVGVTGQMVQNVFSGMAAAVSQTVQAFGGLGKVAKNLGEFFRVVVRSIAQSAAIQSLYELAQAAAAFALSFFWPAMALKAKAHLHAAGLYAAVAGVAGAASAAIGSGSVGGAGALADGGAVGGSGNTYEDNRARYLREQEERDRYTRREDRREESVRLIAPVVLNLDGREIARNQLNIVRDGGDLRDGWQRTLGYAGG